MDPDDIAERVRRAASDSVTARDEMTGRVGTAFVDQLAADAVEAVREASDAFIPATLRPRFAAALTVVQAAVNVGITSATDAAALVASGTSKQLAAFRNLPDAVRILDEIGALRDRLTQEFGVGSARYPAAAYLPVDATLDQLKDFTDHDDVTERRQSVDPVWHYPLTRDEVVHRTGGRWLALLNAGYQLTLSTGPEAHAVVAAAQTDDGDNLTADESDVA